jgi:hypothetical protein
MKLTLWVMAQLGLIWRLNTFLKKNCNEVDSIGTMVDEAMVNKHTLPLLLQVIFSHNAKCRYFFSKLFYQIVGVSMK